MRTRLTLALAGTLAAVACTDLGGLSGAGAGDAGDDAASESGGADAGADAPGGDTGADGEGGLVEGPGLTVSPSANEIVVSVTGGYEITLAQLVSWQPLRWRDLSGPDATRDLGNSLGMSEPFIVVVDPSGLNDRSSDVASRTITTVESNAARARFHVVYAAPVGGTTLECQVDYTFWVNGRVAEKAVVRNTGATAINAFTFFEFGHTNVTSSVGWTITSLAAGTAASFVEQTAAASTLLVVSHEVEAPLQYNDIATNRYWRAAGYPLPFDTAASQTRTWEWSVLPATQDPATAAARAAEAQARGIAGLTGATSIGNGFDAAQGALVVTGSGATPISIRLPSGQDAYAPNVVVEGWTAPTFSVRVGGTLVASSATPVTTTLAAAYDNSSQRLVLSHRGTVNAGSTDADRTITIAP